MDIKNIKTKVVAVECFVEFDDGDDHIQTQLSGPDPKACQDRAIRKHREKKNDVK